MNPLIAFLLLLAPALPAKVHYVNRGVKYHIGDNRYALSEDKEFVDTYPVVGQEWIQAFRVTEKDRVKVRIAHIWGVDDCPYCRVIVSIDDWDMGRLTLGNNHDPFDTLDPLAKAVEPGRVYLLKIASYGDEKVDDFVIEGVSVETHRADVVYLKPGPVMKMADLPLPEFTEPEKAPRVEGSCPGLAVTEDWALGRGKDKESLALAGGADFAASGPLGRLSPGQAVEFFFRAEPGAAADTVGRALEILSGEEDSGWVVSLDGQGRFQHGNVRVSGQYRSARFPGGAFRPGQWNRARLGFCRDGRLRLWINGAEVQASLKGGAAARPFFVRALGLKTDLAAAHQFQ